MTRRTIPPEILAIALDAWTANAHGSARRTQRAYDKWQIGAAAEPCRYGKEQAIAIECHCGGCYERLAFFYFDQVSAKLAAGLTEFAAHLH